MKLALAESVAEKLNKKADVLETTVERGSEVTVTAFVPNSYALARVKKELHQYPVYVNLEITNPDEYDV